jgi:glycosyltransferase involved in cell wall biosynthesis
MTSATTPLLALEYVQLLDLGGKSRRQLGRWGGRNLADALGALGRLIGMRPWSFSLAHVPIAQNTVGLIRDMSILVVLRCLGVPYVVHLHGGYFDKYYASAPLIMRFAARRLIGAARAGLVLAPSMTSCLECVIAQDKIFVVGNGCGPAVPTGALDKDPQRFTVLHITTLSEEKGTYDLLEAARRLPDVHFVMAGPGHEALLPLVTDLQNVTVTGPVEGEPKRGLFASADCFVLPTKYRFEGQPIVLLEAMSAGLPVVSSRRAGIPETVPGAVFVEEAAVDDIVAAVTALSHDSQLCAELGRVNLERWQEDFTDSAYVQRVTSVWRHVLHQDPVPRDLVLRA